MVSLNPKNTVKSLTTYEGPEDKKTQRGRLQTRVKMFMVTSPIGGLRSSSRDLGSEFKPLKVSLQQRSLHVICLCLTPGRPSGLVSESRFSPKLEIRGNFWFSVAAKLRVG